MSNLISKQFLSYFNQSIDSLLEAGALSLNCTLTFDNAASKTLCNNCFYDPITKASTNTYNNTGPQPFAEFTICPVCFGRGEIEGTTQQKKIDLGVIFDSKYFMNVDKTVQIPDGTIQTICSSKYMLDIKNCTSLLVNNKTQYGLYYYERANDPTLCGLGTTDYIITMWNRK
jgi:hypothetical protein